MPLANVSQLLTQLRVAFLAFCRSPISKMAAPVVTRPPATVDEDSKSGELSQDVAKWAGLVVIGCIVLGVVGLIAVAVVTYTDRQHVQKVRDNWDTVYSALKDKTKPDDRVAALESIAEKVKGSSAHAYVLMELGGLYLDRSQSPQRSQEEQKSALEKAVSLYSTVATSEPYASNQSFAPVAASNAALAMEQAQNYDGAIKLLEENNKKWEAHFYHNRMAAQLGRLYYLRSEARKDPKDKEADRNAARDTLGDVLRSTSAREDQGNWREEAEYIKSLVDARGKALPAGTAIPAQKLPTPPPALNVPPKVEQKKEGDAKKDDKPATTPEKKDEKKDEKKEEKKTDNSKLNTDNNVAGISPSGHLSVAQIQQLLKQGKPAFCECPRCFNTDKDARAKLVE
jgi:hypothetical protein